MTGHRPTANPDKRVEPPGPAGDRGRPETLTGTPEGTPYGEPKGPRPPHIERMPKDEVERRAAGSRPSDPQAMPRTEPERARGNFHSGVTTPEAATTTGDEHPKIVRRTDPQADAQSEPARPDEPADRS